MNMMICTIITWKTSPAVCNLAAVACPPETYDVVFARLVQVVLEGNACWGCVGRRWFGCQWWKLGIKLYNCTQSIGITTPDINKPETKHSCKSTVDPNENKYMYYLMIAHWFIYRWHTSGLEFQKFKLDMFGSKVYQPMRSDFGEVENKSEDKTNIKLNSKQTSNKPCKTKCQQKFVGSECGQRWSAQRKKG